MQNVKTSNKRTAVNTRRKGVNKNNKSNKNKKKTSCTIIMTVKGKRNDNLRRIAKMNQIR